MSNKGSDRMAFFFRSTSNAKDKSLLEVTALQDVFTRLLPQQRTSLTPQQQQTQLRYQKYSCGKVYKPFIRVMGPQNAMK